MSKKIAIIGLGYVGLPLALLSARKGYFVYGIDNNRAKIDLLNNKKSPILDEALSKELIDIDENSIKFTTDASVIRDASIIIICVPTPVHEDHTPDLGPVEGASRAIAKYLKKGQLVVLESTVNPGVSDEVVIPILEKESGLTAGVDFYLAHCPERINPGDPKWNVENIPRVVGSIEGVGLKIALDFYRSIIVGEIKPMNSLKEAEAVKIIENSFRDINIAFVNEIAKSFSKLGIDTVNVIKGAATKPFAFMPHYPSCGVGGHCIPVDPYYLIAYAKKNGFHHEFLSLARKINNSMPEFTVEQLISGLDDKKINITSGPVAVLGLAYKGNIDDCRESPAFEIIKILEARGVKVQTYDPHVLSMSTKKTLVEALAGVKGVIIATAHNEFKTLSPEQFLSAGVEVVVDGCNCLSKDGYVKSGLVYKGIGR